MPSRSPLSIGRAARNRGPPVCGALEPTAVNEPAPVGRSTRSFTTPPELPPVTIQLVITPSIGEASPPGAVSAGGSGVTWAYVHGVPPVHELKFMNDPIFDARSPAKRLLPIVTAPKLAAGASSETATASAMEVRRRTTGTTAAAAAAA